MRRMYLNLAVLAFVVFGMTMSTTSLKGQVLINLTNQVWKYDQSGLDPGAFWATNFDDSAWSSGRSILAYEDSVGTVAVSNNILPYTNTVLLQPTNTANAPNHLVDYFRTHFTFSGAGNPNTWVLTVSNLIDDGYVMYLNGLEVDRYNMNANDMQAAVANPGGEGIYVVRELCIPAGTLHTGDNVLAVRVHQNAGTSSDVVWGTVMIARTGSAPTVSSPSGPVAVPLKQGSSSNLVVTVAAAPCATYQWYFDPTGPNPAAPITGANATNYTITGMDPSKAGAYFLRSVNAVGTTDSPSFNVTFDQDTTPPVLRGASANPLDLTQITLTFSEDVIDTTFSPFDPLAFYLEDINNPNNVIGVAGAGYGTSSNIVVLTLNSPRDPSIKYQVVISNHGIEDRFGNRLADPSIAQVTEPAIIQEGVNGYASTQDTEVRFSAPDSAAGGALAVVNSDLQDGTPAGAVHSLLRFDNIFGSGQGQIPSGAQINSAQLRIWTDDLTDAATPIRLIRMLVDWSEASTWNSLVNGIDQTNGVECSATVDAIIDGSQDDAFDTMDVTATVQAWAHGAANHGWVFLPSGNNGWRWATSENTTADHRPRLVVDYTVISSPCNIQTQPTGGTYPEKSPFSLTVGSDGSDLTYQWYFDPAGGPTTFTAIAGATSATYSVARAQTNQTGNYRVVVQNNVGSPCTSLVAVVTITPDPVGPALTGAMGNSDQRTISLTFNDTLDAATAGNPATYSVPGLTISGVGVSGSSVTLTSSAPRVVGQNYSLTITGLRDDSAARNLIVPNPTSTNLFQTVALLPFGATWKYETNGLDLGTAWSAPAYNDSAWHSGTALLGHEDTPGTYTALGALGLNTNNMFLWQLTRPDGSTNITYYLRTAMAPVPFSLAGQTVTLRHVIDDGAVIYLNGVDSFRFNITNNPVTYTDFASATPGEGVIRTATITNLSCGQPVTVAAEVHQVNVTSSDVLFGAELVVVSDNFQPCVGGATLHIVNNGNGTVTLSWTGSGVLQESSDLTNWAPSSRTNGQTFAPVGIKFYRLQ